MVTLDGKQGTGNNIFVCNLDGQALGAEHVRSIIEKGCNNLPCDRHTFLFSLRPQAYLNPRALEPRDFCVRAGSTGEKFRGQDIPPFPYPLLFPNRANSAEPPP